MRGNGRVGGHSVRALSRPVRSCEFHATPAGIDLWSDSVPRSSSKMFYNFPDSWKPTADDGLDHALHALHAHDDGRHAHRGRSSHDERTHLHANDECSHHDGANDRRPGS